ncbi:hypothetical protein quinque_003815 [Culex quinquefasciatus]
MGVRFFVMACAFLHVTFAMDCKEVMERREEIKDCCSAPPILSMDGLKECFEENKDKEKREKFACSFECFFKHHNVLDDNGEPSKEKLLAKVEGFEGEWKQTSIKMIEECFAKHEEMKAKHGGGEKKEGCHPASGFMNMCLGKNFLQNCPAAQWNDSELCNKVKSGECHPKKGGKGGPPPE